jgi:hypothetical protein
MRLAVPGERGVEADDPGLPALLDPRGQLVAASDAEAAEVDDLELAAAPFAQPDDALQGLDVVIERRADEDADIAIGSFGQPPIVEAMNELLEAREGQRAALPRFRDQAIPADMGAGRVPQRKPQPFPDDLSGQDRPRENDSKLLNLPLRGSLPLRDCGRLRGEGVSRSPSSVKSARLLFE